MAYYYVLNTGSSTTAGGTTKQTGAFSGLAATAVYASISSAITYGASDSDIICVSDAHAFTTAVADVITAGGTSNALHVVCVEDANCDVRSTTGSETTTGTGYDVEFTKLVRTEGVDFTSEDLFSIAASGTIAIIKESTIKLNATGNQVQSAWAGGFLELNDCVIDLNHSANYLFITSDGCMHIHGGSVVYTTSTTSLMLTQAGFVGGGNLEITDCDLSTITGGSSYLIKNVGSNLISDDTIDVVIDGCVIDAGLTGFHNEQFTSKNQTILVTRTSSSSADAEYQYYFHTRGGYVEDSTTFYRDGSTAFEDSGQKVSLKCTTDSDAEQAMPFEFEFPTTFAALSIATTDTLRVYIMAADTLTDAQVWAELSYPDGTTKNVFNLVNSLGTPANDPTDPLRTPATLTTNTEAWTGRTTENRYQLDLDTSTDVGADCVPIIRLFVVNTTNPVYFCTTVDVVA